MAALKVLSSFVLCTASAFALKGAMGGGGGDAPLDPPPPVNTVFAGVLLRIGLPADTIACAGIGSAQVSSMIGAAQALYSQAQLATLDQNFVDAKSTRDRLVRKVRSGLATEAEKASLAQAEANFATADATRKSYLDGLQNAALATVSADQAAAVRRIIANRSWGLPTEFCCKDRSEASWVELRSALSTERIAAADPEETFPESAQTYLSQVRGETEISSAKVTLDTNLGAVQTAWNAAAGD
jgi:hypothetical protein